MYDKIMRSLLAEEIDTNQDMPLNFLERSHTYTYVYSHRYMHWCNELHDL